MRVCLGEILGGSGIPNTPPTSGIPSTVQTNTVKQTNTAQQKNTQILTWSNRNTHQESHHTADKYGGPHKYSAIDKHTNTDMEQ